MSFSTSVPARQSYAQCSLAGKLPRDEIEELVAAKAYQSWLYLNSADDGYCAELEQTVGAGDSFQCIPVSPAALTVELGRQVAAAVAQASKPLIIMCNTATRAGAALLLSVAVERGYNFNAAMQLACDLQLKFAADFEAEAPPNDRSVLVRWVEQVLAPNPAVGTPLEGLQSTMTAPAGMTIYQLFDDATDGGGSSTYTYLLADDESQEAMLVDPVLEQVDRDLRLVKALGLQLKYCLNTHVHADHITGSGLIKQRLPGVLSVLSAASAPARADVYLSEADVMKLGSQHTIEVISTPGHTEGCVCYLVDKQVLLSGDSLLIRGCGRTDFQGGDAGVLFDNVTSKLFSLPDTTIVAPGHDYKGRNLSTIGDEKAYNPRLTKSKAAYVELMAGLGLSYPKKIDVAVPANMWCGVYEVTG